MTSTWARRARQVHRQGTQARSTPLTDQTVTAAPQLAGRTRGRPDDPLFATSRGRPLTRDAIAWLLTQTRRHRRRRLPIDARPATITPHVLRHTAAMRLLHAGVDTTVIALWLGHEKPDTVQIYLHADLALKERALARTAPLGIKPGRYRPPDALLAFLEAL